MKIVAVLGSPRAEGNTATMTRWLLEAAGKLGAAREVFRLNQMKFQGCQGCGGCKTKAGHCVVEDDLTPVLAAVKDAEVLVLASPVYFGDLSGQMKCFFDRTYSFANPNFTSRLQPGKKSVLVLAQGDSNAANYEDIFPRYERWLKMFGFEENYLLRATGVFEAGQVKDRTEVLRQAEEIARKLRD
ncbi:MAG: flavodoxin family protein [Thermodesulfobacteriota bacterium]